MKIVIFTINLLLWSSALMGQSPFLGGGGDGYARSAIEVTVGDAPTEAPSVTYAYQELQGSWSVLVEAEGVVSSLELEVFDVLGKLLLRERYDLSGTLQIPVGLGRWPKACFLLRVTIDGEHEFSRKIIHPKGN